MLKLSIVLAAVTAVVLAWLTFADALGANRLIRRLRRKLRNRNRRRS